MKKICSIVICVCYILSFASCSLTKNINNPNVEIEQLLKDSDLFEKVSETKTLNGICVSYKQKHQGLEVFNSFVTKTIDNAGNIEFVGEYYDFSLLSAIDFKNIDVSPEWLKKHEAEGVSVSPNTTSVSPVLYITDKNEVVQALRFTVKIYDDNDINEFLLVTSLNGDTVYYYENFYNNFDTGLVSNGYETIEVMCDAENYYGISKNHYYYVWNRTSTEREDIEKDLTENGFAFNKENIYKNKSQNWSEKYSNLVFNSMSVMNNIEDFWASEYGYHGIDGNRNYAKLIVVDEHLSGTAMCGGRYSIILGTTKDGKYSVSEAPEILAHEFTHGVLKNYCHLKSSDESGALHEAICDVFGVVYSNNTNWKLAEKLSSYGISKDIPAHKRTMDDFEYDDYIIDLRYWNLGKLVKFGNSSDNYVHKNSYILSNTLYEISKNVFDNDLNAFGKIMFNSLRYLPSNAGFSEFRRAFEASVEDLYNNKTARECSKYFEKSGIECSDEFFVKTTVNSITGVPNTQSSQTTPTLEVITNENVTIPTVSTTDATASKPVTDENKDDLKKLYYDYVENNNSYFEYDGIHSDFEPQFYFVDLDNDFVEEAILLIYFESTNYYVYRFATIHILDISDNEIRHIFSSGTVGQSRMTEKIRVYKDEDNYYISRTWRDGNNLQLGTLYTYDGNTLAPQYGLVGCINGPVFFTIGNGRDAFEVEDALGDKEGYENISKEEFLKLQNDLDEKGQTVIYSFDLLNNI